MTLTELFTSIADAIRTKKGTTDKINATDFPDEIINLPSGGGGELKITSGYYLFAYEHRLDYMDEIITLLDNITNANYMFYYCQKNLTVAPSFDTSNVETMNNMFSTTNKLTTIPEYDMGKVNNVENMLRNTYALQNVGGFKDLGKAYTQTTSNYGVYKLGFYTSGSVVLTYESLMNVINKLYDLNLTYDVANGGTLYTQSLVLGSKNLALLTAEEIAIATNKGWNVS